MPLAVQYGMSLDDFWHGDMRLLEVYQKAYLRNVDFTAWKVGNYNVIAYSTAMANAFKKKGAADIPYIEWKDPVEKMERPKVTKDNVEQAFRAEQAAQQSWLHNVLTNRK